MPLTWNIPPTTPTNPRWLWFFFLMTEEVDGHSTKAVMMLPYIPDSDPNPGDDLVTLVRDFQLHFTAAILACFNIDTFNFECGFYWQTAIGLQMAVVGPGLIVPDGGNFGGMFPGQINGVIRKRTARYPFGTPWLRVPFVPYLLSDDGQRLNSVGMAAFNIFATTLNANVNSQGHQFSPASWSSKSNMFEPVLEFVPVQRLARMMRRSAFRASGAEIHINQTVWMY